MSRYNAGDRRPARAGDEQTADSYAATFDTNVLGTLLSMKHELRVMQAQGSGSIVNISSTYGHVGTADASVYVASKHAVEGLTKSAALEVAGSGVRVNAVAPGPTETGMLNRFTGNAERKAAPHLDGAARPRRRARRDRAHRSCFLASEKASFITGHILNVDRRKNRGVKVPPPREARGRGTAKRWRGRLPTSGSNLCEMQSCGAEEVA